MNVLEFQKNTENFAKKIINLAAEDKLTVSEFDYALKIAKSISEKSTVESDAINKFDFESAKMCCCTNN